MVPLVLLLAFRLLLVKLSSPQQRAARTLQSQRFGKLNEGISSNSVVKLMGTSHVVLNTMRDLRKQEEWKTAMPLISNALVSADVIVLFFRSWCLFVALHPLTSIAAPPDHSP